MNPTEPSYRAVKRIIALTDQLPIKIGQRVVLVNRVGPNGAGERFERELAELNVRRLGDVPQDDVVEQIGAAGDNVFSIPQESPALSAVKAAVETMHNALERP
jgi:CO dehydrogenase nickel-insertion accessory protein CooC1